MWARLLPSYIWTFILRIKAGRSMPRKTRRQLVGKQADIEHETRVASLGELERELHASPTEHGKCSRSNIQSVVLADSLFQAQRMLLTVHS
jgi:hypothetical protein